MLRTKQVNILAVRRLNRSAMSEAGMDPTNALIESACFMLFREMFGLTLVAEKRR